MKKPLLVAMAILAVFLITLSVYNSSIYSSITGNSMLGGDFSVSIGDLLPVVALNSPPDGQTSSSSGQVFTCSAADDKMLSNLTLYVWKASSLYYNNSVNVSGESNSSTWSYQNHTQLSLSNGVYTWNCLAYDNNSQSSWAASNYTLTISTVDEPPSGGGTSRGGGSGAAGEPAEPPFIVIPKLITATLFQGQGEPFYFQVLAKEDVGITIEIKDLAIFAILDKTSFSLEGGKLEQVRLDLFVPSGTEPGIYFGKVIVKGGGAEQVIHVIIEVKGMKALFDMRVNIHSECKTVNAGGKLSASIYLENVGLSGEPVDVDLSLKIMSLEEKVLFESTGEVLAVETNKTILRELTLPRDIEPGEYLLIADMAYDNTTIYAHDIFEVSAEEESQGLFGEWMLLLVFVLIAIILTLYIRHSGKN